MYKNRLDLAYKQYVNRCSHVPIEPYREVGFGQWEVCGLLISLYSCGSQTF